MAFVPTTAAAMATGGDEPGLISGVFNTAQQVGNAFALAALAALAAVRADALVSDGAGVREALAGGYSAGLLLATALALAGVAPALRLPQGDAGFQPPHGADVPRAAPSAEHGRMHA